MAEVGCKADATTIGGAGPAQSLSRCGSSERRAPSIPEFVPIFVTVAAKNWRVVQYRVRESGRGRSLAVLAFKTHAGWIGAKRRGFATVAIVISLLLPIRVGLAHESLRRNIIAVTQEIDRAPYDASLHLRRGELYRLHRDWERAQADFERAAELDRGLAVVDLYVGRLLLEEGRPEPALTLLTRYLEIEPESAPARVARARTWTALGRPLDAAADYSLALARHRSPELYLERAAVLAAGGTEFLARAREGLEQAIAALGPVPAIEHRLIELELETGDIDSALRRVDGAVARSRSAVPWLVRRAEILEEAGRCDEAVRAYGTARRELRELPEHRRQTRMIQNLEMRITTALERLAGETEKEKCR